MDNQYSVTLVPASHSKVTVALSKVAPLAGLVISAFTPSPPPSPPGTKSKVMLAPEALMLVMAWLVTVTTPPWYPLVLGVVLALMVDTPPARNRSVASPRSRFFSMS